MRKILLTLLMFGLPGIACGQQPSDQMGQQRQKEQQPQAAQEQPAPREPVLQFAEGALTRVDTQKQFIWIRTQDGKELQFSYNPGTEVEGAGETVEGISNMSGNDLKIYYRTEGNSNIAVKIQVLAQRTSA